MGRAAGRYRVEAEPTPWVAAAEAAESENGSAGDTVGPDGLLGVGGTGRDKAAAGRRTQQGGLGRGKDPPIKADQAEHKQPNWMEVRPWHRVASGFWGGSRGGVATEKPSPAECLKEIPLDRGEIAFGDRSPRDEDQVCGRMHGVLVQSEGFTEQSSGAAANDGISDAAGSDDPDPAGPRSGLRAHYRAGIRLRYSARLLAKWLPGIETGSRMGDRSRFGRRG